MSKARVSAAQVKELIDTNIEDTVLAASFIDTANLFVDTHLLTSGHSDGILEKIELYLAAHYVAITAEEGQRILSKTGDATEEWDVAQLGKGLAATRFGAQALVLDTSGILAGLGTGILKAQFRVV